MSHANVAKISRTRTRSSGIRKRRRRLIVESLEYRHLLASDWTNPLFELDVDDSGSVDPLDALVVINDINESGARRLLESLDATDEFVYLDTDGDSFVGPLDVLSQPRSNHHRSRKRLFIESNNRFSI
jgi:hypothetical protein